MDISLVPISEIDHDIYQIQSIIQSLPRSNPQFSILLHALGLARFNRYTSSDDNDDLEKSILYFTYAIFLPQPSAEHGRNILQVFLDLTDALLLRLENSKQPEDAEYLIQYLHYLRDQPLQVFGISPNQVTTSLVKALAIQVELQSGDLTNDIEEMAILCRELFLPSDILQNENFIKIAVASLIQAVTTIRFTVIRREKALYQLVECLREACIHLPNFPHVPLAFAHALAHRFHVTYSNADYEEAAAILDRVITSEESSESCRDQALSLFAAIALARSATHGNPEYMEESISRLRALLSVTSLSNFQRTTVTRALKASMSVRSTIFGVPGGLEEERNSDLDIPKSNLVPSLSFSSMDAEERSQHIDTLLSMGELNDIADIEGSIKYCRMFLTSPLSNDYFTFATSAKLADLLLRGFHCTHKLEFLNESISLSRDLLNMPVAKPFLLLISQQLISSLFTRLPFLRRKQDFQEIMQLFSLASKDEHANIPIRFRFSCEWAQVSRRARHRSVSFAYQSSMSLMQASLVFAPNLDTQHFRLVSMRESYESLPLDYASYQIEKGQVEKAIEILEQGRALIWSEMRGLRTSIDRLHRTNPSLAERFACVNKELEGLTTSISPLGLGGAPGAGGEGMDWFGHLVVKQRKLMEERDELVSEIQALPSFHNFLNLPQFENLRLAASRGPVIVINHSRCRSDIIIITAAAAAATALHQPSPSLITTPDDFYDRANRLRDHLVDAQKAGLDSKEYDDALTFVLTELYELVGRPVLERLCALGIEEQSHVWWCPTSVFCSLPLHAIGPIPSEQGGAKRYFSDLYIPSYTPTLSALIESRNKLGSFNKQKPKLPKPSILLMAQPDDESLPGAWDEMNVVQAVRTKVTSLISEEATARTVLEGLRDHQFAHFVCHGSLKSGKPFDASFKLHGRERLTLRDIVRSQIANAEFAFLSACHTAELTDKSITDEALHLTAAMQYCGFGSVVGTMWAMADMDGRDLAKHFYKSMFSNSGTREREVGYYERSGEALRDAVKKLRRKKRMTLERWVNFVHYGG